MYSQSRSNSDDDEEEELEMSDGELEEEDDSDVSEPGMGGSRRVSASGAGGAGAKRKKKKAPGERIRATTACDHCSKRRSKCDGSGPGTICSRCLRTGLDCIYTRKVKKRGPQKGSVHAATSKKTKRESASDTRNQHHHAHPHQLAPPARPRHAQQPSISPSEASYSYQSSGYGPVPGMAPEYALHPQHSGPATQVPMHHSSQPLGSPSYHSMQTAQSPYYPQEYPSAPSPPLPNFQTSWPAAAPHSHSIHSPSAYGDSPSPFPPPPPPPLRTDFFANRYDPNSVMPAGSGGSITKHPSGSVSTSTMASTGSASVPIVKVIPAAPMVPAKIDHNGTTVKVVPVSIKQEPGAPLSWGAAPATNANSTSLFSTSYVPQIVLPPSASPSVATSARIERVDSSATSAADISAKNNNGTAAEPPSPFAIPTGPGLFDSLPPIPPQECLNELVTIYFEHVHHYQPFLHRHTVLRTFSTLPPLLQLSIYASAATFSKDSRVVPMNLYNRAKAQYKMEMDRPSHFQTTQALLLLITSCVRAGAGSQAVLWCGTALQMVRHLHLFADPDLPARLSVPRGFVSFQDRANMSWIEKEAERRTFWAVLMVDRLNATAINSPTALKEEDIFTSLPCHDLIWEADLPADVGMDPTGIPISVLLNDPEAGAEAGGQQPISAASSTDRLPTDASLIRYTPGVTQPVGPFAHTAKLYLIFGKLVDHRVRCRNRNVSHLADPELSVALHGWRSQLPAWVIELDDTGIPGIPKLGEDVRWGYQVLIMYHYLISVLFGPGEFRDWVGEKFFSEEAGLLWVASTMMTKCMDSMQRVRRMLAGLRSRGEDPDVLDLGGPFLPYCMFQLGMVGLVAMRAASLGLIAQEFTEQHIRASIETIVWGMQKHGKTNRTGNRLAIHLAKLVNDVGEFSGQFPAINMVERMQQRKKEFMEDMERSNPYRAAYRAELADSSHPAQLQRTNSATSHAGSEGFPTTHDTPSRHTDKASVGNKDTPDSQAVLNLSLTGAQQAKTPDVNADSALYVQFLQTQGIGNIVSNSDLDRLISESGAGGAAAATTVFLNARSY